MRYEREEKDKLNNIKNKNDIIDYERFNRLIDAKERDINNELVSKHLSVQDLRSLLEKLQRSKYDSERNKINSGLRNLKKEIEDMGEEEKQIENPDEIVNLVEMVLEFNRQQQGQGLKILTSSQMLCKLPISLAQLKAGSNSEKIKNEIRQLLYLLCRSKKLTKNGYNNLINAI